VKNIHETQPTPTKIPKNRSKSDSSLQKFMKITKITQNCQELHISLQKTSKSSKIYQLPTKINPTFQKIHPKLSIITKFLANIHENHPKSAIPLQKH
jgi:hypothetical protein